jgi:putative hemolysin
MMGLLPYLGALALFIVGLRLSAFFSGVETGFYRASYLRLSIDAQAGDPIARQILTLRRNPTAFVVTALVGNNIADYVLTAAVGIAAIEAGLGNRMAAEVVSTIVIAPVVFTFGELIPKHLYYRAPLQLLRSSARWFLLFHRLFLPISFPLVLLTRLTQRLGQPEAQRPAEVLGRARLVQVLTQGHQEGLLTDVQGRLIEGLMQVAAQPVIQSVTPPGRVLGVADNMERQEILNFTRRYGLSTVAVRQPGIADSWYGYVRVIDVALMQQQPFASLVHRMPVIDQAATKLEALLTLRTNVAAYGMVKSTERLLGIASQHGLLEQLFRIAQTTGTQPPDFV